MAEHVNTALVELLKALTKLVTTIQRKVEDSK